MPVAKLTVYVREELERQLRELESRVLRRDARLGSREAPRRTPDAAAAKARHPECLRTASFNACASLEGYKTGCHGLLSCAYVLAWGL